MISFSIFITKKNINVLEFYNNKENIISVVNIEKVCRWMRASTVYTIHHDKQNTEK